MHIAQSEDKLSFIQFTQANTMRHRWYLIQVDTSVKDGGTKDHIYFCTFFQRHPIDENKPDNEKWRELLWYEGHVIYDFRK